MLCCTHISPVIPFLTCIFFLTMHILMCFFYHFPITWYENMCVKCMQHHPWAYIWGEKDAFWKIYVLQIVAKPMEIQISNPILPYVSFCPSKVREDLKRVIYAALGDFHAHKPPNIIIMKKQKSIFRIRYTSSSFCSSYAWEPWQETPGFTLGLT